MSKEDNNLTTQSPFLGVNALYLEDMYEKHVQGDGVISKEWNELFESLEATGEQDPQNSGANGAKFNIGFPHSEIVKQFKSFAKSNNKIASSSAEANLSNEHQANQSAVIKLINAYRSRGHKAAQIDPLGITNNTEIPDLQLAYYGLTNKHLSQNFLCDSVYKGENKATLSQLIATLEKTYCASIGSEFMHIVNNHERKWIQQQLEFTEASANLSSDEQKQVFNRLTAAEGLEKYLGSKYPGVKRFGLEGAESLIPLMDEIIQYGSSENLDEVIIGMAHRGRINVLINLLGKNISKLVDEFEGNAEYEMGSGDVKYHQGYSNDIKTKHGKIHLALAFNPSHLEIVSPVVLGSVRARQDARNDSFGESILPMILHGDAAFSGQGVVMETLQMSQTRAYKTGGTVHIVINNQVGFTTNKKEDSRSTDYCTDIAKVIEAPVFHVNGDDPEAVMFVARIAIDYRNKFKKDVIIDLVCYRRRGHNEADEPFGTQPQMYKIIKKLPTTLSLYTKQLIEKKILENVDATDLAARYREKLARGEVVIVNLVEADNDINDKEKMVKEGVFDWSRYLTNSLLTSESHSIGVENCSLETLKELAVQMCRIPIDFSLQRQVNKVIEDRLKMLKGELPINWGFAECLAYASILHQDYSIRISGQDVGRGTFSHRHCTLHDQETHNSHIPLQHLDTEMNRTGSKFEIYDSLLSELAVVGFEYGYSTTNPKCLVIWEAQFGDFANGAQMIIDQFITSGENKWGRLSGLTMLLPHGYEGQGPEHSSARLERFLQLSAEHNIQVCVPTTPAQIYHLLRRQVLGTFRKPLIVMSPKSLLRSRHATSTLKELSEGSFQTVIDITDKEIQPAITRIVLCSGRVYYDLLEDKMKKGFTHVALIRIEQLYPFPTSELKMIFNHYPKVKEVVWCQEEPKNQGAWYSSQHHLREVVNEIDSEIYVEYKGREASAAPAAGYSKLHNFQLESFLKSALEN